MSKCAQAMREVDMYCPCPDSHPMWQTEELREKMVEYARKTWIKSTQLPPELAAACAELCVDSYVDTVRFADDAKEKRLPNRVKALWDANKIIADVLFRYALEKDPQKQRGLMGQWLKEAGKIRMGSSDLATAYETFREMTGDIPVMNNDTQARMVTALSEMGYLALARLQFHENHKNVAVQKAAKNLSDAIRARLAKPTLDNVAAHLKQIQQAPNSPAATHATSALKAMGNDAVAPLIQVVELDLLSLKKPALEALAMVSGKDFGTDLAMWKQLAETIKNQPPPMEVKRVPKEEVADEIENEVEDIRIGIRPPRKQAEPDDE
jgi:hypothetical protein